MCPTMFKVVRDILISGGPSLLPEAAIYLCALLFLVRDRLPRGVDID